MYQIVENISDAYPLYKQAVYNFLSSMEPYLDENTLKMLIQPEQIHVFKVPWRDRHGQIQVNTGYRVQHSQSLGPYKGGLRFDPSVNLDTMMYLAFEQTLKNALTNLPLGGAKGGADFDPHDKTDAEIFHFTESFIKQSHHLFGADKDVPAGDLGVGKREIGYMLSHYRNYHRDFTGVFTGKPIELGGVLGRQEATGYGLVYMVEILLKELESDLQDKTVIVSGCGNVGIHAAEKAYQKGAKVVGISDRDGYVYDETGLDIPYIKKHSYENGKTLQEVMPDRFEPGSVFEKSAEIVLPCATQNEMTEEHLRMLVNTGTYIVAEGANGPLQQGAHQALRELDVYYLPGKAANAGGVAVSAIEMQQNASKAVYTFEEVDARLQEIMQAIFTNLKETSLELDDPFNFFKAGNHIALMRLKSALKLQGLL